MKTTQTNFLFFFPEMKSATQKTPKTEKSVQLVSISPNNWQKNRKTRFFLENEVVFSEKICYKARVQGLPSVSYFVVQTAQNQNAMVA